MPKSVQKAQKQTGSARRGIVAASRGVSRRANISLAVVSRTGVPAKLGQAEIGLDR